jgi:hypothetical protein
VESAKVPINQYIEENGILLSHKEKMKLCHLQEKGMNALKITVFMP